MGNEPVFIVEEVDNVDCVEEDCNHHGVRDVAELLVLECCEGEISTRS